MLGHSQNHLAVAGGYAVGSTRKMLRSTHPLPRGGSDCIQGKFEARHSLILLLNSQCDASITGISAISSRGLELPLILTRTRAQESIAN